MLAMARPPKHSTRYFQRQLTDASRAILLAAGQGDISRGWHEILDFYARAHDAGYRPGRFNNEGQSSVKEDRSDAG